MEVQLSCPACRKKFKPRVDWQECCSVNCASRLRMRRYRNRLRYGNDDGPGGGKRQRHLFPKTVLAAAKPPKPEHRTNQDALFPVEAVEPVATMAVGFPYGEDGVVDSGGLPVIGRKRSPRRRPCKSVKIEAPDAIAA